MTEHNRHDPNAETPESEDNSGHNTTYDLRAAAEEARRMFARSQPASSSVNPDDLETVVEDDSEYPTEMLDRGRSSAYYEGSTPAGLTDEAAEAMSREQQTRERKRREESAGQDEAMQFAEGMLLELHFHESAMVMRYPVEGEMVIGRADTHSNHSPEVDLTPYGAYRLGLSRRHAVIHRSQNGLLIRDLGSRNGTFVNNMPVSRNGTCPLRSGDQVRFGNLTVEIRFVLPEQGD